MTSSKGNGTAEKVTVASSPSTDRITVALIPKAEGDLRSLQDRTGLSKTDLVNRAITLYEFIEARLRAGQDLLMRDQKTGQLQAIVIL